MQIEPPAGKTSHAKPEAVNIAQTEWAHIHGFGSLIQKN
jgi:hypothetical protein